VASFRGWGEGAEDGVLISTLRWPIDGGSFSLATTTLHTYSGRKRALFERSCVCCIGTGTAQRFDGMRYDLQAASRKIQNWHATDH
jgi:hypothetical protein